MTKKKNISQKLQTKKETFLARLSLLYPDITESTFSGKPRLCIRVNRLRSDKVYPNPIPWAPDCYVSELPRNELVKLPEAESGEIYLQNPSSFIPPLVLDPQPGELILDMCAAPGGKASHVAMLAGNDADLWINDNSKSRLLRMRQNVSRLGVKVYKESMFGIERIAREIPEATFDKILLDAPCSGEGALNLNDPASLLYWSPAQIKRLSQLQKQAIAASWKLLKPGGTLVYSTCTMAPEENESVIDWLLQRNEDAILTPINLDIDERVSSKIEWNGRAFKNDLRNAVRIKPSQTMEAFFVAKVIKTEVY